MERIYSFSEKKFLSFSSRKQHKKCAEILQCYAASPNSLLFQEYEKLSSWMGLEKSFKIEERFHYHLLQANWILPEHKFLLTKRTGDKEEGMPWLHVHTYLDGLRSCHNVGSIIRTIEAFRLGPLHFSADMMPCDHPLIQKVSMGSWKDISLHHENSLTLLPRPWIALETIDSAIPWKEFSYPDSGTLLLGNEERGISEDLLKRCDATVTIPLFGKKNSLNVANAFAILAAEVAMQQTPKRLV